MAKNIAFFADGTWDEPLSNSNVFRLYSAAANDGGRQAAIYDSGVGTDGDPLDKIVGGGFGAGLFQKIREGYDAIASRYVPGDQIYIFGFSRGAYTARSLAGMITVCGLPTVNQADPRCLDMAFEAYRNVEHRQLILEALNEAHHMVPARIQFLGVWDTVGSLGIPAIFGEIDVIQYGFLDTNLHPNVLNAAQALAIDERRLQFQPAIWTSAPAPGQTLSQVWFSGVHCDVGGGYTADANGYALSNVTLYWMATLARNCGLLFKDGAFPAAPQNGDALATLHDSLTGLYRISPYTRDITDSSTICLSVQQRCADLSSGYMPDNIRRVSGQLAATYQLIPW